MPIRVYQRINQALASLSPPRRAFGEWCLLTALLLAFTLWLGAWVQQSPESNRVPDPSNTEDSPTLVDYLNLRLYDFALRMDGTPPTDEVVLIDIDDISMLQIGRWPWPRPVLAALVNRIAEGRPEALAIDILFAEVSPRPHEDLLLRTSLQDAARQGTRVVLAVGKEESSNNYLPLYPLDLIASGNRLGHINFHIGHDGLVRGLYLDEGHLPALALALVDPGAHSDRSKTLGMLLEQRWDTRAPILPGNLSQPPRRISAAALLRGDVPASDLAGRKVLLGSTALGSGDFFVSPLVGQEPRRIAGLELHAVTAQALLSGHVKKPVSTTLQGAIDIVLVLLVMVLLYGTSPMLGLAIVLATSAALLLASWLLFVAGYWLSPGAVLSTLAVGYPLWNWRRLTAASVGLLRQARSLELVGGVFGNDKPISPFHEPIAAQLDRIQVATQQVGRLNRFLSDSLQSLPHPVLVADHDQRPILHNQRFLKAFGKVGESCTSITDCFLNIFGPLPQDSNGDPSRLTGEWEDQQKRHWRVDVSATGAGPDERRWLIQFVDLTAQRLADREREETLSFLSHDLRSPQATILAIIEKLRHATDPAEREADLDALVRHSRRALELTDGFLAYTRAEIKQIQVEEFDLNDLITEVVDLAWFSATAKKIRLVHEAGEPALISGDIDLLRRALSNLVENAIRHGPVDSLIELGLVTQAGHYLITVRDQGPGVPPGKQALIFKPFWQAEGGRDDGDKTPHGSAGLGLAMVQKAIRRHGGSIRVYNHPQGGAIFEITLPRETQERPAG